MKSMSIDDRYGMDALSHLFGPDELLSSVGEANSLPLDTHLEGRIDGEFTFLRSWLRSFWVNRRCPVSNLPPSLCEECCVRCETERRGAEPEGDEHALADLMLRSPFVQGQERRQAPHAHELRDAVAAIFWRVRRLCWLYKAS